VIAFRGRRADEWVPDPAKARGPGNRTIREPGSAPPWTSAKMSSSASLIEDRSCHVVSQARGGCQACVDLDDANETVDLPRKEGYS
jgi:hypothetical protein